ncbi:MAG: phosphoribosyl-AMP cyclohydrolase [Candidatus Micrarchaeota archaeon]|nr:phosphoribosyl-AMP cyclohydrolase [Candidatus Micrarchaeota archaeon]
MLVPSIDLMNGKAVQLIGGEKKALESGKDPVELAKEFNRYGEVAVIDLDAALGLGDNIDIIKKICRIAECRVGGGIRTVERAEQIIKAGAKKIIIGTAANREFLQKLPKERIIVALDSKKGKVVDDGWRRATDDTPKMRAKNLEAFCSGFLYTIVDKEGRLGGTDLNAIRNVAKATKNKITAAGGITTVEDIKALEEMGIDSQIGMALYTGKLDLADTFVSLVDFKRNYGFAPTVVQDASTGQVLMVPFSSPQSLKKALETGQGWYYSRSRKRLWRKGEESGNTQELVSARYDCDRDTLLFKVKQKGVACHLGWASCFGDKTRDALQDEFRTIAERVKNLSPDSFTSMLAKNENELYGKLCEETGEVIKAKTNDNLIWEIADVLYLLQIFMAKRGIEWQDVFNEIAWRVKG